jgi:uncharacterized BrkB/YihY/UPF0761 family membrane protein
MFDVASDVPDAIFGRGGLAVRLAWTGAVFCGLLWFFAIGKIWQTEPIRHHLIARILSSVAMIASDVLIIAALWPPNNVLPDVHLNADQVRAGAAFYVGMQIAAGIWQITAPPRGLGRDRGPWKLRSMRRRPKVIVR